MRVIARKPGFTRCAHREGAIRKVCRSIIGFTKIHEPADCDPQAGFFSEFTRERIGKQLARVLTSARQIPERLRVIGIARGHEQNASVALKNARAEVNTCQAAGTWSDGPAMWRR